MSASLQPGSVLEPLPDIIWRTVAGETVLLDPAGSVLMGLNGSAGRMWEMLDGKRSLAELAGALAEHYDQSAERVLQDLMSFAGALLEKKLARLAPA